MNEFEERIAQAEAWLRRARHILSRPGGYGGEEWLLLASLVGEADLVLRDAREQVPRLHVPLLAEVVGLLREATANFTDIEFLRSTRAARRKNRDLFMSG